MPSFRGVFVATAAILTGIANADYFIEPSSVPRSTRESWCSDEKTTCPIICQQTEPRTTLINDCDADELTYGCLCGNNQRPNVSEYSLTLPYFICQEWGNQCVKACKGANQCAADCREKNRCGATNPKKYNTTSTSTEATASQTDSPDTIYTNGPGGSASGSHNGATAAFEAGSKYSLVLVLTAMFAGFAML
ncbi:hypothetical protein CDD82_5352 [Ophiocordyceps australis]|uniref:DUF7707 domain-containing protein n=1 Tax=Ophiocordyceps australis TaxID=1399860 RepID=A0A2C5ZRJ9_9HYPO|nr:hypothetical protein CDD82_5352 [Ophiocordyceps australis]